MRFWTHYNGSSYCYSGVLYKEQWAHREKKYLPLSFVHEVHLYISSLVRRKAKAHGRAEVDFPAWESCMVVSWIHWYSNKVH